MGSWELTDEDLKRFRKRAARDLPGIGDVSDAQLRDLLTRMWEAKKRGLREAIEGASVVEPDSKSDRSSP